MGMTVLHGGAHNSQEQHGFYSAKIFVSQTRRTATAENW